MPEVLLVVDLDDVVERFRRQSAPLSVESLARGLRRAALVLGSPVHAVAFVSSAEGEAGGTPETDRTLPPIPLDGFVLQRVSGTRDQLRCDVVGRVRAHCPSERLADRSSSSRPICVLVTGDPALASAVGAEAAAVDLHVWHPPMADPEKLDAQRVVSLESLLDVRKTTQVLFIDFENVAISLSTQGYVVDPALLADCFTTAARAEGELRAAYAYADWQRLPAMYSEGGNVVVGDAQRVFEMRGIETRYLVTIPGKNTADMRIADHVRDLLERDPPSRFILATGDRDFSPVVSTLASRGCEVVVWGVRGCTSPALARIAQVCYIDELVPLSQRPEPRATGESQQVPLADAATAEPAGEASRPTPWTKAVLLLDDVMQRNGWPWLSQARVAAELARVRELVSDESDARAAVNQALTRGILVRERIQNPNPNFPDQFTWACRLNPDHPTVAAARLVPARCLALLQYHLARMPYVSFSYLMQSMGRDPELSAPWLGLDNDSRALWINFLVSEGKIVLTKRPHHRNPNDLVSALTIGPQAQIPAPPLVVSPAPAAASPNGAATRDQDPEAKRQTLEDVRRRMIVSIDSFTKRSQLAWAPVITLRQRLLPFGRDEAEQVLRSAQASGELIVQEYPNPHRPYPTRGASLRRDAPGVRDVLDERDDVIRLLARARQEVGSVTAEDLAAAGLGRARADLWLSILQQERMVIPERFEPGGSPRYALDLGHPVVVAVLQADAEATAVPPTDAEATMTGTTELAG